MTMNGRKPIYDREGHNVGEVEFGHDHHQRGGFSRLLVLLIVAGAIGYGLNTEAGHNLMGRIFTPSQAASPSH